MKKKLTYCLIAGVAFFLLFLILTVLVKTVDVKPVTVKGPEVETGERAKETILIGLKRINHKVFRTFGVNKPWYVITEVLGVVAILVAAGFAVLGVVQLIKRKSLLKVDRPILILGVFYVIVILFYLLFEVVKVNYRPIMPEGVLEASYPSSHTMMTVFVMLTAIVVLHRMFSEKKVLTLVLDCVLLVIAGLTAAGRLVCGYHWFTDIVAGGLLSLSLTAFYCAALYFFEPKETPEKPALSEE